MRPTLKLTSLLKVVAKTFTLFSITISTFDFRKYYFPWTRIQLAHSLFISNFVLKGYGHYLVKFFFFCFIFIYKSVVGLSARYRTHISLSCKQDLCPVFVYIGLIYLAHTSFFKKLFCLLLKDNVHLLINWHYHRNTMIRSKCHRISDFIQTSDLDAHW